MPLDRYKLAVLGTSGLLAYLRLGESSGTTAADESGNGRTGTYAGGLTRGTAGAIVGSRDTSVTFNGTTGRVTLADAAPLRLTTAGTVELWVNLAATPNAFGMLAAKASVGTAAGIAYLMDTGASGRVVRAILSDGTSLVIATGGTSLASGVWYHLAMTWDGSYLRVYVNGVIDAAPVAQTLDAQATTPPLTLAANADGTARLAGSLDEFAAYSRALSAAELLDHYTRGITPNPLLANVEAADAVPRTADLAGVALPGAVSADAVPVAA